MEPMYCIGLDVHKRKVGSCVRDSGGKLPSEGSIPATLFDAKGGTKPNSGACRVCPIRSYYRIKPGSHSLGRLSPF